MFTNEVIGEIAKVADELRVGRAALLAVAEVESGGRVFARVGGQDLPLIRFEGHYFDRRLAGARRSRARAEGLSSPKAGAVANPPTQAERWAILERAVAIDRRAALESTSWGIGQVMGAHWDWLGYASVDGLVSDARSGAAGQARLMGRFISRAGLRPALRARDWAAFARGYNGPGYEANGYHTRMAAAYRRFAAMDLAAHAPLPAAAANALPDLHPAATGAKNVRRVGLRGLARLAEWLGAQPSRPTASAADASRGQDGEALLDRSR
ncbi:MAG TPA: N-acetylmuramidase family protein [Rhizobiales bacterium]|nr:N-acetylmuramidase family protein [Hyphomicrobiales bacterium]